MKRFLILAACLMTATAARASRKYAATLVNEAGLAYNSTFTVNVAALKGISMGAVYSSAAFTAATFTDGVASTGSITVVSTAAIHGVTGTDTLTIVSGKNSNLALASATNTITIASNTLTALNNSLITLNGRKIKFGTDYFIGTSSNTTAISMSNAINANSPFTSTVSLGVITLTAPAPGLRGNRFTLTSSTPTAVTVGAATFAGGQDAVFFTLNGRQLTNGTDWSSGSSSTATAKNIATVAAGVNGFTASTSSNVVTVACSSSGTFCNSYTLTSSSSSLSVGAATFSGGVNQVRLAINGNVLTEGTDFSAVASSATAANNISDAIIANSATSAIVTSTAPIGCGLSNPCGVVKLTAKTVGKATNYSLWTSLNASLLPFAPAMKGGANSAVVTGSGLLNITSHGFTTALPLLMTVGAGTAPQDLYAGSTYYVVVVDANDFKLATTSLKAQAGTNDVRLSTQTATGGGSFTLTPLAYSGTASFFWEASDDNVNYNPVGVSSVTYSSASATPTSTLWDFGDVNFNYLRLNVTGPTQGGLSLVVTGNGRYSDNKFRP